MLVGVEPTPSSGLLYSPIFFINMTLMFLQLSKHVVSMLDSLALYFCSVGLLSLPFMEGSFVTEVNEMTRISNLRLES